jgi:hypothetical protein
MTINSPKTLAVENVSVNDSVNATIAEVCLFRLGQYIKDNLICPVGYLLSRVLATRKPPGGSARGIDKQYLDLLKKCLTFMLYGERYLDILDNGVPRIINPQPSHLQMRIEGHDWPGLADTMIGLKRLDNLQSCAEAVLANQVPGDFIECGVWRGGASIFLRGILKAHSVTDRRVWVADSFQGLPTPNPERFPADSGSDLHTFEYLAVSLEEVKENFNRYGLLDDQVCFLKGWFCDTLPTLSNQKWSLVRLDGDMYESTMNALENLYPNLSSGGYIIVDDYGCVPACRQAVEDYRETHGIREKICPIDWTGVFWQRELPR